MLLSCVTELFLDIDLQELLVCPCGPEGEVLVYYINVIISHFLVNNNFILNCALCGLRACVSPFPHSAHFYFLPN